MEDYQTITEQEVMHWMSWALSDPTISRLTEILNGEYPLDEARKDILSFRIEENE